MSTAAKPAPFGPDLRSALVAMVRKRVPESEVEDIVQSALAEAIGSPHAPTDSESLRRWIFGVAKNKVVDYHRRAGRESFELPDVPGTPAPHVEADLLRWAERNLPEGDENQKTLDWMLREGEGEKLESIAASEKLPPPRVRQRVSRLRRHFKENWQREVALLAALGVIVSGILIFVLRKPTPEPITHEVVDPRAEPVRRVALEKCAEADWKNCIEGLDEAKRLDPAGDARPDVQGARQAARQAEDAAKAPVPTPEPAPAPSPTDARMMSPDGSVPLPPRTASPMNSAMPPMKMKAAPEATTPAPMPKAPPAKLVPQGKPGPVTSELMDLGSEVPSSVTTPEAKQESKAPPVTKGGGASKKGGGRAGSGLK
jgi:DNA-directed RNA polymerase specialized sigma24 family protein